MIIPRPKKNEIKNGKLYFDEFSYSVREEFSGFIKDFLSNYLDMDIVCENKKAIFVFDENKELSEEGYQILVDKKVMVEFSHKAGLRNALSTLVQIICFDNKGFFAKYQTIEDAPEARYRSVLIDLARGLPDYDRLKEDIKRLVLAKCNNIHFHIMDTLGLCYESEVIDLTDNIRETKLYTKERMKDLVKYCEGFGINAMPEIEFPAHGTLLLTKKPVMMCECDAEKASPWAVCVSNDNTYAFFEKLLQEVCEIFTSPYIHIGGDELYFNDIPEWNYFCRWDVCKKCSAEMKKYGYTTIFQLYCHAMNKMNEIVKKLGRRMIIFNDEVNISEEVELSKDIIIQYWRISDAQRGPRKGCSLQAFLDQGFKVINSDVFFTYIDVETSANPERISYFVYNRDPQICCNTENVLGTEVCAWEYGNPQCQYYRLSFTPSAILLLDKAWNLTNVAYDREYRAALTKLILGIYTQEDFDMLELFGSAMPPRTNDKKSYFFTNEGGINLEELESYTIVLDKIKTSYSPIYLNTYRTEFKV